MIELAEYHTQWSILLGVLLCLWCGKWVMPRFGIATSMLMGYLGLNAIWVWVWVNNRYLTLDPYNQTSVRYFSADSLARMMLIAVPMMALVENKERFFKVGKTLASVFVVFQSLWILCAYFIRGCEEVNACGGAGNPSIMMGAVITMLPIVIDSWKKEWPILVLVSVASFASHSSIAIGLFSVYGFLWLMSARKIWAFLIPIAGIAAGAEYFGVRELFSTGDRVALWEYMMALWPNPKNIPQGTGFGTYHVFSVNLQNCKFLASKWMSTMPLTNCGTFAEGREWNTMHNDWLQMLFEGGVIGAFLMVLTYLSALYKSIYKNFSIALSVFLYGIYMSVNPALHHAIPVLFAAWLFTYALKSNSQKEILCFG